MPAGHRPQGQRPYGGIQASRAWTSKSARATGLADRLQWRRQDHHDEGHHRHPAGLGQSDGTSNTWAKSHPGPGPGTWSSRPGHGARRPAWFTRMTITENPADGRPTSARTADIAADMDKVFALFPRLKERATSWPAPCRAASSRCWPWGRALMSRPRCCCWTSPRWASRPSWWTRSSRSLPTSIRQGVHGAAGRAERQPRAGAGQPGYVMESARTMERRPGFLLRRSEGGRRLTWASRVRRGLGGLVRLCLAWFSGKADAGSPPAMGNWRNVFFCGARESHQRRGASSTSEPTCD